MEDIVAVKVRDSIMSAHYFITWGRIFDRVDPKSLEAVVAKQASSFGIKNPRSVTVCDSLQEASHARYFHEAIFHISQEKIPFGKSTYGPWCAKMKRSMLVGQQLFYCGISKKLPNKIAPLEPPPVVSTSSAPVNRTLDSLPAPASRGGR
ncbi:MAG: hypothetical protein JNL10_02435 [Verrucomicrobiales bacterium]|nr:hypothetical protein [Verrucomicrobiales bacterium]